MKKAGSFGLGSALAALSKQAIENARRNAALRRAVANASAAVAKAKTPNAPKPRAPSPPKPKARTPSPPKPKARTPSPPKPKARSAPRPVAAGPRRFRSPNRAAYQRLSPRSKRGAFLAPTRFIQNLMNEEARLITRSYQKYNANLKENARLRAENLRRVREIQDIIGAIHMKTRDPTHLRLNPFVTKSPRSRRRSPARGRSLSAIREAQ
jgi:hypothetical protein